MRSASANVFCVYTYEASLNHSKNVPFPVALGYKRKGSVSD
jgi:hypothetical protein